MWKAIIFDLDDTLYPEQQYVLSGFRVVAKWAEANLGIAAECGFAELCGLFHQGVRGDTFNHWLAMHARVPDDCIARLVQVYREHEPVLTPFPDVSPLLATLRQKYVLGLITDGFLSVQQRKLSALGLAPYFDVIVFSDTWGRQAWKPNTKPFEVAVRQMNIHGKEAVYIADNPAKDFFGARQIGMCAIRIQRPGCEYTYLIPTTPHHAPHLTIASLNQLTQLLVESEELDAFSYL